MSGMSNKQLLRVGTKCNNNCILCEDMVMKANYDKSLAEIEKEIKSKDVILPCNSDIREDFLKILALLKSKGVNVTLQTNGRVFYNLKLCTAIRGLVQKVVINFFGRDEMTHDKITQVPGSYQQAKIGLKNLEKIVPCEQMNFCAFSSKQFAKPREVVVEVTDKCNLNCNGCFNKASFARHGRNKNEMSTEYIKEIIDSISYAKINRIRFSGGEPLLRGDIIELMEYSKSKGLTVRLNTNATLVTKEIAAELEKYVANVLIPFNGFDEESDNKWTRSAGSYKDKLNGVELLKSSRIPIVRGGTVATQENIENLEKIYSVIQKFNIDSWEVWRPIPLKQDYESINVFLLFEKLIKLSIDYGRLIPIANSIPFCSYDKAKMNLISFGAVHDDGHSRIVVDPVGFAKPSYFIDKNIGDPRDIMDCWNNEFMKKMRNLKFLPKECKGCSFIEKCKGGSRYVGNLVGGYWERDSLMGISPD